MMSKSERLTVLSEAEQFALYGMPDFDDGQQLEYLSLSETELALACSRPGLHAKAYCALQIGYFKAKHAFFRFTWDNAQDDCTFVLTRYFNDQAFEPHAITKHEHYAQRTLIAKLFGYRPGRGIRRGVIGRAWLQRQRVLLPGFPPARALHCGAGRHQRDQELPE